ncbi:MAG: UDP-N-acetylmuramoyl-L-alanyl-D-glutamate--2,6-diaminopimelate ligase [Rhizomicrobium sp.]
MLRLGNVDLNRMTAPIDFEGLASDSRQVKPGYLFAALPGIRADGGQFIEDAVARGAVAVLGRPELARTVRSLGVEFLADENPRLRLAQMAAQLYGAQPSTIAAITGTNGKTSVSVFLRQIWAHAGLPAASLGTIGLVTPTGDTSLQHTTPDPLALHRILADLKQGGIEYLALEASSHGLDQYRLDGVRISAGAFTNLTRDHLDYHATFEDYLAAKLRLFADLIADNGVAVVNADAEHAETFVATARQRKLRLLTVGANGQTLRLQSREPRDDGQALSIVYDGALRQVRLPLPGEFQASNALVAAGLALGLGLSPKDVFDALAYLRGAPGRLEKVAHAPGGAAVYVDYAHTPDAIETALTALRPHVAGRLHVIFGCGGDRDKGKRALMGAAAARCADVVIVTDDNPRSEDPALIRREALAGCPAAREIGNRRDAIREAIASLKVGDALVIAGKGHESGQIIGGEVLPFSDLEEAVNAAVTLGGRTAEQSA